jgi:MFS family permease
MRSLVPWFVVGLGVQAVVAIGLLLWGRWAARRQGTRRWRNAAWLPMAALLLNVVGAAVAAWLAARIPAAPGPLGPEARQAWRMQFAGAGAVMLGSAALAAVLYAVSVVLCLVGTVRASSRPAGGAATTATSGPGAAARGGGSS